MLSRFTAAVACRLPPHLTAKLLLRLAPLFLSPVVAFSPSANAMCPNRPIGITVERGSKGETFFATAYVIPLSYDDDGLRDASSDASIAARVLLKKDPRIPRAANGHLLGVVDVSSCINNSRVYASVSVNRRQAEQARELYDNMNSSIRRTPTPGG